MFDRFNRSIDYLRISVTDRCNLRCSYCMPAEGIALKQHSEILTFEEIIKIVEKAVLKGITKIRLTGGEPLVRKGIVDLVRGINAVEGITEIAMTTNGLLLAEFAVALKDAGLSRVNISLDSVDKDEFAKITGGGDVNNVFQGIDAAIDAELLPVKINCVVWESSDEVNARQVKLFAAEKGLHVRFIHQMDLKTGKFSKVEGGKGGKCIDCNRLRLTADGCLKPCLFSDKGYNVKEFGIDQAIKLAIDNKPKSGTRNHSGEFYNIGG